MKISKHSSFILVTILVLALVIGAFATADQFAAKFNRSESSSSVAAELPWWCIPAYGTSGGTKNKTKDRFIGKTSPGQSGYKWETPSRFPAEKIIDRYPKDGRQPGSDQGTGSDDSGTERGPQSLTPLRTNPDGSNTTTSSPPRGVNVPAIPLDPNKKQKDGTPPPPFSPEPPKPGEPYEEPLPCPPDSYKDWNTIWKNCMTLKWKMTEGLITQNDIDADPELKKLTDECSVLTQGWWAAEYESISEEQCKDAKKIYKEHGQLPQGFTPGEYNYCGAFWNVYMSGP